MSVWLRVANAAAQPSLQLAFEGNLHGERYYRWAEIGAAPGTAKAATPIGTNWAQFVFPVDDLPLEGLTQLHVRFDLIGPGEVWIDDVQLFDRAFSGNEVKELTKLIMLAHVTLQNGKVGDCMRLLEGYWPRFLEENVPLRPGPVARKPDRSRPPAAKPSRQSPGILDRIKGILPRSHRS